MNRTAVNRVYQTIGLDLSSKGFGWKLIVLIHVIYVCGNLKLQFDFHKILFHHPDFVGNTTNLIEMSLPIFCHLTIVLESLTQSSVDRKIQFHADKCSRIHKNFKFSRFCWLFVMSTAIFGMVYALLSEIKGEWTSRIFDWILIKFFSIFCSLENPLLSDSTIARLHECIRLLGRIKNRFHPLLCGGDSTEFDSNEAYKYGTCWSKNSKWL